MYWWHMKIGIGVSEGVERARQIMNAIPAPKHKLPPSYRHDVASDSDSVRLITSDFIATVKCLPQGKKESLMIVIVAGQDDAEAKAWMRTIRDTMQSGNIAGLLE
jgi:hypothetical protein